jgi:flagellar protein FliJ
MSTMKSVMLAIDGAIRARDQAASNLAKSQLATASAQSQLDQLEHYASDTECRWSDSSARHTTAELMRHHYQFLDRLHHAIGLQREVIRSLTLQVDDARNILLQLELRLAGLKKLEAKQRSTQNALSARREQVQMDEFAALQHTKVAVHRQTGGRP